MDMIFLKFLRKIVTECLKRYDFLQLKLVLDMFANFMMELVIQRVMSKMLEFVRL